MVGSMLASVSFRVPFKGSTALASGLLTRGVLRGPRFRRLFPDVYIASDVAMTHALWCRAALLYAGPYAVLGGLSAALMWGVDLSPEVPELIVPPRRHLATGGSRLKVVASALDADEVGVRRSMPTTSLLRTICDAGRRLPRQQALIAMDALAGRWAVEPDAVIRGLDRYAGWTGCLQALELASLVEPLTESPMETVCRLLMIDSGLPRPVAQHFVLSDRGTFLARLDLAYPWWLIGLEYEGDYHRDRKTFQRDIARYRALEDAGWMIMRVTADDVLRKQEEFVARVWRMINTRRA